MSKTIKLNQMENKITEEELTLLVAIMKHLKNVNAVGDLSYLDELQDLHD